MWDAALHRLRNRREIVTAAGLLTVVQWAFGGLSLGASVAGAAAVLTWALGWPDRDRYHEHGTLRAPSLTQAGGETNGSRWSAVLEALPDCALVLDRERRVIYANEAARTLYPGSDGREITQLRRTPELLDAIDTALSTGLSQTFALHDVVPVERYMTGRAAPLSATPGAVSDPVLLIIVQDRTEAEQLAQMRADFVANASHELRTPLASLKGFVETLQSTAKDDPQAREQFLGIMQEQATRMSRLIEDLLSLSRIEMREHVAPTARVDLNVIAKEVVTAMLPVADAGKIKLSVQAPTDDAAVLGDRDELVQVAQNLIQNAVKYGKQGGRVDVTVKTDSGHVLLTVADDGIGIAPQHLPRLTERFYRVSAKESRERGGTGLGLAIVKHIVNRHHGELRIDSRPGKGSTFTVALPRAA
jgi:two-component system phosphate regulon sensor histidine kinase PhoR